jgi:hypothetical protein
MGMGYAFALVIVIVLVAPLLWAAWWLVAAVADHFNPTYPSGITGPERRPGA